MLTRPIVPSAPAYSYFIHRQVNPDKSGRAQHNDRARCSIALIFGKYL
jgi:hypothetical protein